MNNTTNQAVIKELELKLDGLKNDAYYWDMLRQHGYSIEVLRYLRGCAAAQAAGANHT